MQTTLFLQSEMENPYRFYEAMLHENDVYWDETNQVWAVYSYVACKATLSNKSTCIPVINFDNVDGLNEYALRISTQLARLNNGVQHEIAKQIAILLLNKLKTVPLKGLAEDLLEKNGYKKEIDWVKIICKRLPVAGLLKGFEFNDEDCYFIVENIEYLVKIMLPVKTPEQVMYVNDAAKKIYIIIEKHLLNTDIHLSVIELLSEKYALNANEVLSSCVSNLAGLFIQSYDAGRGLLSNSLLQVLNNDSSFTNRVDEEFLKKSVIETLRYDPPIHNTRRKAVDDIRLNDTVISKGESMLIVVAAANKDPLQFVNPSRYDIYRSNNHEHLTLGAADHSCPGKHFSVRLATETLSYFFKGHKKIRLVDSNIQYEPMINARLPKEIFISIS